MRGRVVSGGREAVVALRVLGPAGRHAGEGNSSEAVEVEAVIDTALLDTSRSLALWSDPWPYRGVVSSMSSLPTAARPPDRP
jgi:hypothetical protein